MKKCTAKLIGRSPLQFGKAITSKKDEGELPDVFEERTWRERMHVDADGICFIPPMALKLCLEQTAQFLSEKIPSKGQATYTKHFRSGIMVTEGLSLGIKADDVQPNRLFVPSDGKKGGGKRVYKLFPTIQEWQTTCEIIVIDQILCDKTEKVLQYLEAGGRFIGFLSFAPRVGGYFGRYGVEGWAVEEMN